MRSLRDRLEECRRQGGSGIPPGELLRHLREAAEALDALHEQGRWHGDVKPDNLLLAGGRVQLAAPPPPSTAVVPSTIGGTPAYMAPEVWGGQPGGRSDQYSLACTYAELRLGRRPFRSTDVAGVMNDHLHGTPDLGPLPEAEQNALRKALAKDPSQRYPNCRELSRALEQAVPRQDADGSPMKCPGCGQDMQAGAVEVTKSGWGWAWDFFVVSWGRPWPAHLAFTPKGGTREAVLKERKPRPAFRCPGCRTLVIPGGPAS
jgi:serine/threonine protein kinase